MLLSKLVVRPLGYLLHFSDPTMRTAATAGVDVARLATNNALPGERGYLLLLNKTESSPDSRVEAKQDLVWAKSAEWAGVAGDAAPLG